MCLCMNSHIIPSPAPHKQHYITNDARLLVNTTKLLFLLLFIQAVIQFPFCFFNPYNRATEIGVFLCW